MIARSLARSHRLTLLAALAVASVGCAGKATKQEFVGSIPDWKTMVPQPTANRDEGPAPPIEDTGKTGDVGVDSPQPPTPENPQPVADPPEDPATFSGYVDQIKTVMPDTDSGVAAAIRIENQTTGHRSSYIFKTSSNFDTYSEGAFYLVILSRNNEDIYMRVPKLKPGHYECPEFDLLLGDADKSLSDPESADASNPGGWCELDIYPGNNPTDIQGKFSAKLMFNNGEYSYTIESGYFYARDALSHEYKAPPPRYTGPGPGPTGPGPSNPNNQQHNYHR